MGYFSNHIIFLYLLEFRGVRLSELFLFFLQVLPSLTRTTQKSLNFLHSFIRFKVNLVCKYRQPGLFMLFLRT